MEATTVVTVKSDKTLVTGKSAFDNFQRLIKGLVRVPKKEVETEEARWHADRLKKKKPAT
jgi:hypothetical protein